MSKKTMRVVAIILAALFVLSMLFAFAPRAEAEEMRLISGAMVKKRYEGGTRENTFDYWLYTPESFGEGDVQLPLIVSLHSGNGTGTDLDNLHLYDEGLCQYIYRGVTAPNAVVIMPQSPSGWWFHYGPQGEDTGCDGLMELIEHVVKTCNIDRDRIYITGVSRGGCATFLMVRRFPYYFAGAMPIASATNPYLCASIKTPMRIYHGREDLRTDELHMGNSVVAAEKIINENGGNCQLFILDGVGHGGQFVYWDYDNYDAMSWLFAQSKVDGLRDVNSSDWFGDCVKYVVEQKIFNGNGDGTFTPYAPLTRAMTAQILFNLYDDFAADRGFNTFSDVDPKAWYRPAVTWAASNGIMSEIDGKFRPNENIRRQELVTAAYRYMSFIGFDVSKPGKSVDLSQFTDGTSITGYDALAFRWAIGAGIITGYDDGTIRPDEEIKRAEAAAIFTRLTKGAMS